VAENHVRDTRLSGRWCRASDHNCRFTKEPGKGRVDVSGPIARGSRTPISTHAGWRAYLAFVNRGPALDAARITQFIALGLVAKNDNTGAPFAQNARDRWTNAIRVTDFAGSSDKITKGARWAGDNECLEVVVREDVELGRYSSVAAIWRPKSLGFSPTTGPTRWR
jgi:hypothetical protein